MKHNIVGICVCMLLIVNVSAVLDKILRMVPTCIPDTKISTRILEKSLLFIIVATFHLRILRCGFRSRSIPICNHIKDSYAGNGIRTRVTSLGS